ncbi:MAG: DUF4329 domain-containing protein [Gammaproteobacteria bacterium]
MPARAATAACAIVTLIAAAVPGAAEQPPPRWFGTELDAVIAAARTYNPQSVREDREFMGAILRAGDCYTFTVGAGRPGRDLVTVRITVPADAEVVAFWHTHGARRDSNQYFSDIDTALVEAWQKPFYLADHTGSLKVMAPGAPTLSSGRAFRLGLPRRPGYARGAVITNAHGNPVRIATRR